MLRTAELAFTPWATATSCAAPPARYDGPQWITHDAALGQSDWATTPRVRASARIATRAASSWRDRSSTSRKNGPSSVLATANTDPLIPVSEAVAAHTAARPASMSSIPAMH